MAFFRTYSGAAARTKYFTYYCVTYVSYITVRKMFATGKALKEENYNFHRVHQRELLKIRLDMPELEPHEIDEGDSGWYRVEKRIRKKYELPKLPEA